MPQDKHVRTGKDKKMKKWFTIGDEHGEKCFRVECR